MINGFVQVQHIGQGWRVYTHLCDHDFSSRTGATKGVLRVRLLDVHLSGTTRGAAALAYAGVPVRDCETTVETAMVSFRNTQHVLL